MSFPAYDLNDFTDEAISQEYSRRLECRQKNICSYCGEKLNEGVECQRNKHSMTFTDSVKLEHKEFMNSTLGLSIKALDDKLTMSRNPPSSDDSSSSSRPES